MAVFSRFRTRKIAAADLVRLQSSPLRAHPVSVSGLVADWATDGDGALVCRWRRGAPPRAR